MIACFELVQPPWLLGQSLDTMPSLGDVLQVEVKYMLLAKDMMAFEKDTTQHWMQHAHASAEALLRQPVLVEDPHTHRSWLHLLK